MTTLAEARLLGSRLGAATDELNARLEKAEMALNGLGLGVEAVVPLGQDEALVYSKGGKFWGLSVFQTGVGTMPLSKASRRLRIEAAHKLGALLDAMIVEAERQGGEVDDAIGEVVAVLDRIHAG